ncbi:MAG: 30S ribosome-binding factor RbfA [Anaerolineae bacterium]|nr:30S ribosome-binding factor RbfA [Anaerolineae bacterium]
MSTTKRRGRAAEMIEETLNILLSQAADERLNSITVTDVDVNQDMSAAKVWITVSGGEDERKAAWEGLKHAQGFLRHEVTEALDLRRAPTLTFHYDESVDRGTRVMALIEQLEAEQGASDGGASDGSPRS